MNAPKIRFIVETVSCYPRTGSGQHYARITSTVTGRCMRFHTGGPRNAAGLAVDAVGSWDVLYCNEFDIPPGQWRESARGIDLFERNAGRAAILELEQVKP